MTKLYRPFLSPGAFLHEIPFLRRLYNALYTKADQKIHYYQLRFTGRLLDSSQDTGAEVAGEQFLGALQPIFDMTQDVIKTFQPYRSKTHYKQDLLQLVRGCINMASGLVQVAIGSAILPFGLLISFAFLMSGASNADRVTNTMLGLPLSWMIKGVLQVVRGAAQVVSAPLTWLFKFPLRVWLTSKFGYRKVTERAGIKKLYEIVRRKPANGHKTSVQKMVHLKLYEKFLKAEKEGTTLPAGIDLHADSNSDRFCFEFAGRSADAILLLEMIPKKIKPYLRIGHFKMLTSYSREALLEDLRKISESNEIDELAKEKSIVTELVKYDMYDAEMLTFLAWKANESYMKPVPKDVVKIISSLTVKQRNVKQPKERTEIESKEITERTALLR